MEMNKEVICIVCPRGCHIDVKLVDGKVANISGNVCQRGKTYAEAEVTNPKRVLTTTVSIIDNGNQKRLPVRTKEPIPKNLLMKAMKELKNVTVKPPVKMGDVVYKNIAGSGVDVIASKSWE
ncbi:DUF1667 domain-containing protein [Caldicellulosiruptor acetigenus]|uniref:DUF1667 domain-containing protein n=1 Tax=Caldicellulosiruptor acetigenus TaxID=301953 RepID=UPI000403606A|nr:DUF1667 domain-containing protein [Caldicellulosiruptor acetigenus]WAM36423.1 DUF1667 domain-containing protein [Caldicellulosiruptor acetigenus]